MSSGPAHTVRLVQRLRTLSEAECYARCYGWRGEDGVKVVRVELEHRGFGGSDPRARYDSGWDVVLAPCVETASKKA